MGRAVQRSAAADSKREQRKIRKKKLPFPLFYFAGEKKCNSSAIYLLARLKRAGKRLAEL